jgi:hypothetical protein
LDRTQRIHPTPANPSQQNEERNTKEFKIFHKQGRWTLAGRAIA